METAMEKRTIKEVIIDRLLLLYLVVRTRQKGFNISGDVKLQKMLYKTQESMYHNRYKGLNYNFIRWTHGPFEKEIYVDVSDLGKNDLLQQTPDRRIEPTERGFQLIEEVHDLFEVSRNSKVKEYIDKVINEFGPLNGREIKESLYGYPKLGERKLIKHTKTGEVILPKLNTLDAKDSFWIDDELLETLEVLFDPESYKSITKGVDSLRTEEGQPFIPILE